MAVKRDEFSSGELEGCECQQPLSNESSRRGSSYDNLILANYITILSLQEQEKDGRRNISWTLTLCKRDTQMTARSPSPIHDLTYTVRTLKSNLQCMDVKCNFYWRHTQTISLLAVL